MPFAPVVRDAMLNAVVGIPSVIQASYASLHSNVPDASGSNEIAGGSPAYARKPVAFAPSTGGVGRLVKLPTPVVQFDVPAGATVVFCGLWTAIVAGSFLGYAPLTSDPPNVGVLTATTDKIYCPGHGLADNDRVHITPFQGMSTPPGLPPGIYYAQVVNPEEFRLTAVLGGSAVDASASGPCIFQRVRVDTFSAQGVVSVASLVIGFDG